MGWGRNKAGGWGEVEEKGFIGRVAHSVIQTIWDVVPGGVIKASKTSYSDTTNTGFWLGVDSDGLAKFHLGSTNFYLRWTGSKLEISGSLTTKNGYVQIVDESTEDYGEGITLLMAAWLASGALRWKSATAKVGAYLTTNTSGTASTSVLLNAYPQTTGVGNTATVTLSAYNKAAGEASPTITSLALSSAGTLSTTAATTIGGAADVAQLTVSGCEDGQTTALIQAKSDAAAVVFAVANSGAVSIAGTQVLTSQQSAIADVSETGAAEDATARAKINDILAALRAHGLIDT